MPASLREVESKVRRILFALVIIRLTLPNANAASIQIVSSDCFFVNKCSSNINDAIVIRGTIEKGDAAKFHDVVQHAPLAVTEVILRSNGGDVTDSMEIGRDVRKLLLETEAPMNNYNVDQNPFLSRR
jgi:hypothetical protein